VEKQLEHKFGFEPDTGHAVDHRWWSLRLDGLPPIRTKVSHGNKEISQMIAGKMAKQLRVPSPFFREMIACTKSKHDYYDSVRTHPVPPWEHRIV
jgi:hypothetical protein